MQWHRPDKSCFAASANVATEVRRLHFAVLLPQRRRQCCAWSDKRHWTLEKCGRMLERVGQRRMHDFERALPGLKRQQCEAEGAQVRTPAAGADGFLLQTKPKTVQYCFVPRKWLLDSLMLEPLRCCYGQKNRTYRKARRLRVWYMVH